MGDDPYAGPGLYAGGADTVLWAARGVASITMWGVAMAERTDDDWLALANGRMLEAPR